MEALVWAGGNTLEVRQLRSPEVAPNWSLVEVGYAGLCGTDLHIASNQHPRAKPGVVLGHEFVGRVVDDVGGLEKGSPVFVNPLLFCGTCATCRRGRTHICETLGLLGIDADGGAAELAAVPNASLVPLPPGTNLRRAALIEPTAVAVRAVRRSEMAPGDRVHILGAGPIGLLVARCARLFGAETVTLSEISPLRARAATERGIEVVDSTSPTPRADVVFDCTGHPQVAPTIAGWAVPGGMVTVVGVYPGVVSVDLQDITMRELSVHGTRVYTAEDVGTAMSLVGEDDSEIENLITAVLPLSHGPSAMAALQSGSELKVLLKGPAA
jgi:(R,R)-butanediol dehydrogenase / meso-butanediol dehydrogenase / diacetyl reductase